MCVCELLSRALCDPMDCSPPGSSVHEIFQAKDTGVGCHFLLQGIFPTPGLNPGLLHCRQILYRLSYKSSDSYLWLQKFDLRDVKVERRCGPRLVKVWLVL